MDTKPVTTLKFLSFSSSSLSKRYCHTSLIALFALIILAVFSVTCPVFAEQQFALIGTWESMGKATQEIPSWTTTIVFKQNGTFTRKFTVVPTPAQLQRHMAPGEENWRGTYKATGASSWVATVQDYKHCEKKRGSCGSCPKQRGDGRGFKNACADTRKQGLPVGVPKKNSVQMQGPDTFVTDAGDTYRRVR